RETVFNVVADRVESNVKPRVFFEDFPNRVLYVRDLPAAGGWRDVFLADLTSGDKRTVYFAREGRIMVDRKAKTVVMQLTDAAAYTTSISKPDEYEGNELGLISLSLDPQSVFPPPPSKGAPEMTLAELRARIVENEKNHIPSYGEYFMMQQKVSLPLA